MGNFADKTAFSFADYKPLFDHDTALVESNRCLDCYDAPCIRSCPTGINIPGFIKKIASDNLRGSARMILEANILGASCARVCPVEELCEGACVLHDLHEQPISIGRLQRYATDRVVMEGAGVPLFERGLSNGGRVALVGSGPASLGCAAELAQLGYEVACFERSALPGGLNTFGIADYKMNHSTSLQEIEWVRQLGVEIRCGVEIGTDIGLEELLIEYDAVFLGIGLGKVSPIGLKGEDLEGVRDSLAFIEELKVRPKEDVSLIGKSVAVLGGGNTAIDAAVQAAKLGADRVYLVYRRGLEQMGAYEHEQVLARKSGVIFMMKSHPKEVVGEGGRVIALECQRNHLAGEAGELLPIEGSEFRLAVDLVLRATGQSKLTEFLGNVKGLQLDDKGRVVADHRGRTSRDRVWTGGDCVSGGQEVVHAVAEGKRAALDIHAYLQEVYQQGGTDGGVKD